MENIGKILQREILTSATIPAVADDAHGASDDDEKQRCYDQREALPGEPVCIICRRYGEYICDETDDDICGIECKKVVLKRVAAKSKSQALVLSLPPVRLSIDDECYYVRDSVDKSFVF